MNWRDLREQRLYFHWLTFRRPRMTAVQAQYAAWIPWRIWWN